MSIFSRFFGKGKAGGKLQASQTDDPLALTVLFASAGTVTPANLEGALRKLGQPFANASVELDAALSQKGTLFGLAGWDQHVIRIVGFDAPFPADALETCLAPAHFGQAVKEQVRQHVCHAILYYAGQETSPLEQYRALTALAGAMAQLGGLCVLNETAHTALPLSLFTDPQVLQDYRGFIEELPLLMLHCGFVKYEVEGVNGVWMRSYGAERLGLANFAALAAGHHEGERYFSAFGNVLNYLLSSQAHIAAGHTLQIGENEYFRLREPQENEYFLHEETPVLVAEIIGKDEITNAPA